MAKCWRRPTPAISSTTTSGTATSRASSRRPKGSSLPRTIGTCSNICATRTSITMANSPTTARYSKPCKTSGRIARLTIRRCSICSPAIPPSRRARSPGCRRACARAAIEDESFVVPVLRASFSPLLDHAAADGVGRNELEPAVFVIQGFQKAAIAVDDELAEKDVAGIFDDDIRAVVRRVTRVDDDDAALPEFGLHAVAQHAQGIGFQGAATALSHALFLRVDLRLVFGRILLVETDHAVPRTLLIGVTRPLAHRLARGLRELALARADQRQALAQILDSDVGQGVAHVVGRGGVLDDVDKRHFHGAQDALFHGKLRIAHCARLKGPTTCGSGSGRRRSPARFPPPRARFAAVSREPR